MKFHLQRASFIIPVLSAAAMVSCVETGPYGNRPYSSAGTVGVYTSFPSGYRGDSYYYSGRHYTGGRHEVGRFNDQGRSYNDRYYHDGHYLYGGTYRQHPESGSHQNYGDNRDRGDHDDGHSSRESYRSPRQSSDRHYSGYRR